MRTPPLERSPGPMGVFDPSRLTDLGCLGFAGWTLLCHTVVFSGGSLRNLVLATSVAAAALVVWIAVHRRIRGSTQSPTHRTAGESTATAIHSRYWLGAAALVGLTVWIAALVGLSWSKTWALSAVALVLAATLAFALTPPAGIVSARRRPGAVWALALACVVITLVANRPDIDDSLYVCMAQGAADSPAAPLLAHDHLHGIAGVGLVLPTYKAHSIEVLSGALAYLTTVPAIAWLHLVFGPIAAAFAVFATARVAALLAPGRWLSVTTATVAVLLVVGNAHAWYGNLAFVRLHQGKAIFVTAVIPLILSYAIELASRPTRAAWLRLAAVQIAAIGTTATAIWVAPVTAMLAAAASIRPDRRGLRILAIALTTTVYPCVLAAGFWWVMHSPQVVPGRATSVGSTPTEVGRIADRGSTASASHARSFDVDGQLERSAAYVLDGPRLRLAVLGLILWGWWVSPEHAIRRLHLVAASFVALVLVNPLLVERLSASVTGTVTYWRIAWVLPIPLLAGCLLTAPVARVRGWRGQAAALVATMAVLLGITTQPVFGGATGARLGVPGLKVTDEYTVARALVERVPPGSEVVAPISVSPWITTFPHHPYPVIARREYLGAVLGVVDDDEIVRRILAVRAVGGPGAAERFEGRLFELLDHDPIAGVVVAAGREELSELELALRERGFVADWGGLGYRVWIHRERRAPSRFNPAL